ncbi:MAG TPA: M14 family metallopeptidase [Kouleothrix sp.]|uniref:M14 family metallopeptidase n=1 Tax=Kouleothrix sp. TaxID=2779161 RepID=UPI002C9DBAAA|nr:M14 family metallopeptidase [Kouleothrix sp.]
MLPYQTLILIALLALLPLAPARAATQIAELTLGSSAEGRPITAVKIGGGPRKLVLVGDTHGGPEANTFQLASQLADYFRANSAEVPAQVRLYIIPTINPDGLAAGTRFNGRGVDLNRNMDTSADACPENDWRIHVQGAYGIESDTGGPFAESEAESQLVRDFLLDASGVIFFHSSGGDVFPAFCEHAPSIALAQAYAAATGYTYDRYWQKYMITGGMHDWAGALGIAAITPELASGDQPEFEQNLAGVQAVLRQAAELLPLPADQSENGMAVPALIWRFWRAHGGAARFGMPLAPPERAGGVARQFFERALFELHPDQADTPLLVQAAPLGRMALAGRALGAATGHPPADEPPGVRYFSSTGHTLREAFLADWEQHDGAQLLGAPITEEFGAPDAVGVARPTQYFERGALAYYDEDASVRLVPLGWFALARARLDSSTAAQQIR